MTDKSKFVDGVIVKKPSDKAPEFIIANIAVNIGDFLNWANQNSKNGWVNFIIKESQGGKFYAEIDTFDPKKKEYAKRAEDQTPDYPEEDINPDSIPF